MLTAQKLEKIMQLEDNLRAEYQAKLDEKTAEVERYQQQLAEQRQELQATIDKQLETITELSGKATGNQRVEQVNRELTNRAEKLQEEVAGLKKRVKSLQKDLTETKAEYKVLKQLDPIRMKKNLDSNKKKLAEKTRANDMLQKSLNQTKAENAELQRKVEDLEAQLAQHTAGEQGEEQAA